LISDNIFDHFEKKTYLFNKIFSFPKKGLIKKIFLLVKLRKKKYDKIIVFDGKDRSIIFSYFLKGIKKIIFTEKRKINFAFKKLLITNKKYEFIYNNMVDSYYTLYSNLISKCGVNVKEDDFKIIKYENLDKLNIPFITENNINDYTILHIDEKWFSNYYINEYTDISPDSSDFINFIKKVIHKTNKNIIITTGIVNLPFLDKIKLEYFKKIENNLFLFEYNNLKTIILLNSSMSVLEKLIMNSRNLVTCNSSLSQIAGAFKINLIDIIEKELETWYMRHVFHIKKYNKLFRKNFNSLSNEILEKIY
tara:strand:- start:743 stop:1663 length:921 start_codon:yes stop_codon:yes gene_type:complete